MNPFLYSFLEINLPPVLTKIIVLYHTVPYREEIISRKPKEYEWHSALDQYENKISFGLTVRLTCLETSFSRASLLNSPTNIFTVDETFPYNLNGRIGYNRNNRINYNYCIYHKKWGFGLCRFCIFYASLDDKNHEYGNNWKRLVEKVWKERREIPSIEEYKYESFDGT